MYIASRLHVRENVFLEFRNRLQWIGYILILLNITNDLCSLATFGEINEVRLLDLRRNTILDKSQICQINTCCLVSASLESVDNS